MIFKAEPTTEKSFFADFNTFNKVPRQYLLS